MDVCLKKKDKKNQTLPLDFAILLPHHWNKKQTKKKLELLPGSYMPLRNMQLVDKA